MNDNDLKQAWKDNLPVILRQNERFFVCLNSKEFYATALFILNEQWEQGVFEHLDTLPAPPEPSLTKKEIDALRHCPIKTLALKEWEQFDARLTQIKQCKEFYTRIERAIRRKDSKAAFDLLTDQNMPPKYRASVIIAESRAILG